MAVGDDNQYAPKKERKWFFARGRQFKKINKKTSMLDSTIKSNQLYYTNTVPRIIQRQILK